MEGCPRATEVYDCSFHCHIWTRDWRVPKNETRFCIVVYFLSSYWRMAFRPIRVVLFMSMGRDEAIGGVLFIPNSYMRMETHDGMLLTGQTEELGDKNAPVPLCPPQTLHGLSRARTRASTVRGMRLTAGAKARPHTCSTYTGVLSATATHHYSTYTGVLSATATDHCSTYTGVLSATATDHCVRMNPTIILKNVILYEYKRPCILFTQYDDKLLYYYSSGCIYKQNGATVNTMLRQKHVN
jgi:hypothetical protein